MTVVITERGWRCLNLGCPEREPVRAAAPPKCYTCARPMAEVHYPVTEKEIARLAAAIDADLLTSGVITQDEIARSRFGVHSPGYTANGFAQGLAADEHALRTFQPAPDDRPWSSENSKTWRSARREWKGRLPCGSQVRESHAAAGERMHKEVEQEFFMRQLEHVRPVSQDKYDYKQLAIRATSVGIDNQGQLSVRYAPGSIAYTDGVETGLRTPVSVGYDVQIAYTCTSAGCPTRAPVRASSPPTCYTCQQPMSEVAEFTRPAMVSGVSELIEDMQRRIAASGAIPTAVLLGSGGLEGAVLAGAAGETAAKSWYDRITGYRSEFDQRPCPRKWDFNYRDLHVDRKGPPQIPRDDYRYPRPGEQYKPTGAPVTLDGEPITVRGGFYTPDGGVRLLVPRGDADFWLALKTYGTFPQSSDVRDYHTIEWAGFRAEFQAIETVRRVSGYLEVTFRRLRPNLRAEEIYPALAPDIAAMRDAAATPEARLAAAARLLEHVPEGLELSGAMHDLYTEIREVQFFGAALLEVDPDKATGPALSRLLALARTARLLAAGPGDSQKTP